MPDLHVAHLALELGLGRQSGDRIDHQHIDRAGAHQRVGDLERLLAGVRLGDQQILEIDAELPRIDRVERMLGIDEAANAAALLRLGDDVQSERGLARGFRAVNLDDAAARQPADAERDIEPERAAWRSPRPRPRFSFWPSRMIEPLPQARSICEIAASSAFSLSISAPSTRRSATFCI